MSFISKLKGIFSPRSVSKFYGYVSSAYPIVEFIAIATPTKMDDQIIAVANQLGVKAMLEGSVPKGEVLKNIAVQAARKKMPEVPAEIVARAVEAAYQQMKAREFPQ